MADENNDLNKLVNPLNVPPMYQYGSSAITQLTNPEAELMKIELILRNQYIDAKGNIKQIGKPLMNEKGISAFKGFLIPIVNQNTIFSSLPTKSIPLLIDFNSDLLIRDILYNSDEYELRKENRDLIFSVFINFIYISMKRADEESFSDKKFWGKSFSESSVKVENSQNKKGFLGNLFNRN